MIILPKQKENIQSKHSPATITPIDTAFAKSALNFESASDKGGNGRILYLSPELALKINPKRADLTAALILYGLYTWQKSKPKSAFSYRPLINGKPACYRSLRQLESDYPWLANNSILKAINRAEVALKGRFVIARDGEQLHFQLSDGLIKAYFAKRRMLSLKREDALKYGVLEAIILRNLEYVINPKHNSAPVLDNAGNIYRELSPTKLTRKMLDKNGCVRAPLPVSTDSISKALKHLKAEGAIKEHVGRKNFFTVTSMMFESKTNDAKVSANTTKGSINVDKVSGNSANVSSRSDISRHNSFTYNELHEVSESLDSNIDRNPDGNEDRKCVFTETSELRSNVSVSESCLSSGARKLIEIISKHLNDFRQNKSTNVSKVDMENFKVYEVLDFDQVRFIGYDIGYEFIEIDSETQKPYSRQVEIQNAMRELEESFRKRVFNFILGYSKYSFSYTQNDLDLLRQLFESNPFLTCEHIRELFWSLIPQENPLVIGAEQAPKKGHDVFYFARRIKNLKQFLHYLPQLIREQHVRDLEYQDEQYILRIEKGKPIIDYCDLEEPLLSLAFFGDNTIPVTYKSEVVSYDENGLGNYEERPIYYNEFIGSPTIKFTEIDRNPIVN